MSSRNSFTTEQILSKVGRTTFDAWVEKGKREHDRQLHEAKALGLNGKHDAEGNRITRSTERQFIREYVAGEFASYISQATAYHMEPRPLQFESRHAWLNEGSTETAQA